MSLRRAFQLALERLHFRRGLRVEIISAEQFYAEKRSRQDASYKRVASKEVKQRDLFTFNEEVVRGVRLKWPKGGFSPLEDDEHADQG